MKASVDRKTVARRTNAGMIFEAIVKMRKKRWGGWHEEGSELFPLGAENLYSFLCGFCHAGLQDCLYCGSFYSVEIPLEN